MYVAIVAILLLLKRVGLTLIKKELRLARGGHLQ